MKQQKRVGILTAGGDSPGLNAAIRAIGRSAQDNFGMEIVGFRQGFRGLIENRTMSLSGPSLSGILTLGGTILGTSRDKPHKMHVNGETVDLTDRAVDSYHRNQLDVLVCLGGGGTQKNAYRLAQQDLNIITLPKTIDNDVAETDITFGFDTALGIATEAIDRLHSTAHSHHRIIVVEIMGNKAGWLALGAGVAGGADVILIPEIPYSVDSIVEAIRKRRKAGKNFSIVAVAEGAMSQTDRSEYEQAYTQKIHALDNAELERAEARLKALSDRRSDNTLILAKKLEALTGLEARVTILGHVQRGGTPSAADRLLATAMGAACAEFIEQDVFNIMVAMQKGSIVPQPLENVVGKRKTVPLDHSWIASARQVGTNLGE